MIDYQRRLRPLLAFAFCSFLALSNAGAQTDKERAGARSAATDGIAAFNEGRFEEALRLFERAESVIHAPTHLLLMARSQAQLGLLLESAESYQKLIVEKLPAGAPEAFVNAQVVGRKEKAEVSQRIPKLTVVIKAPPGVELSELVVKVDGEVLTGALVGISVPTNPGSHEVLAVADGMDPGTASVELSEGAREEVVITLALGEAAAVVAEESAPEESSDESDEETPTSNARQTWGWVSVGTGAALVGTGAIFGVMSLNQMSAASNDPNLCGGGDDTCTENGWDEKSSAQTKALIADIGIGVGIAAVGVGTYLLLTGQKSSSSEVGVQQIVPSVGKKGGFLSFQGAF